MIRRTLRHLPLALLCAANVAIAQTPAQTTAPAATDAAAPAAAPAADAVPTITPSAAGPAMVQQDLLQKTDTKIGTGAEAGLFAAKVNQPLRLWALWPK